MTNAYLIDAMRTPLGRGKPGGMHADVHPVDLLAEAIETLVSRSVPDPAAIDDVIAGCVSQAGEQSYDIELVLRCRHCQTELDTNNLRGRPGPGARLLANSPPT